jgi:hypothetical protein
MMISKPAKISPKLTKIKRFAVLKQQKKKVIGDSSEASSDLSDMDSPLSESSYELPEK